MNEHAKLAEQALLRLKSDDLHRAKASFSSCTPEAMQREYGLSGLTRQQYLDDLVAHELAVDAAIRWVRSKT